MSVFNIGDVVYHTLYPNHHCVITAVEDNQGDLQIKGTASYQRFAKASELSFTPWPAPCHERPFTEVGWWILAIRSGTHCVSTLCYETVWRLSDNTYSRLRGGCVAKTREPNKWVKFLGKEIE